MKREYLVDLNAFAAVAEAQSFTRAAATLGTSQSALSHAIRRLEERLGVRLLTRTTRSVAPTQAGERLLATVQPALASIDSELTSLGELRDKPGGSIRITTSAHAAKTIIWPKLAPLLAEYPDIQLELSVDAGFTDIVSDRFDAGVRLGEALAKDMIAVPIGPELSMAVVGSPDYLDAHPAPETPQDLANHRCINLRLKSAGSYYAWELEQGGREIRVRVEGQFATDNVDMIRRAAIDGFGLAILLDDSVAGEIASGKLIRVMQNWCPPFAGYYLYYPNRQQPSAAFALVVEALRHRS